MNYKEQERRRLVSIRDKLFQDPGGGIYRNKPREFVLAKPELNLWELIREPVIEYFKENKITWWPGSDSPTGHLLSSQIACINHLFILRDREDLATYLLQKLNPNIERALPVESGYVEFEMVGSENLGGEKYHTRGANCTSIDALMLGEEIGSRKVLFLLEWKYVESYRQESKLDGKSGETRMRAYKDLLEAPGGPFIHSDLRDFFYEPFYQMMRQTLLASEMVERGEYGAIDWQHVHVIPDRNNELLKNITSPGFSGKTICEAWKRVLLDPERYISITPEQVVDCIGKGPKTTSLVRYLSKRYSYGNVSSKKLLEADLFEELFEPDLDTIIEACFQNFGDTIPEIERQIKFLDYCLIRLKGDTEQHIDVSTVIHDDEILGETDTYSIAKAERDVRILILKNLRRRNKQHIDLTDFRIHMSKFEELKEDHKKLIEFSNRKFGWDTELHYGFLMLWCFHLHLWYKAHRDAPKEERRRIMDEINGLKAYLANLEQRRHLGQKEILNLSQLVPEVKDLIAEKKKEGITMKIIDACRVVVKGKTDKNGNDISPHQLYQAWFRANKKES